ncbi:MAG: hypothetical protein JW797_01610 [Bradymonadales bacterium]|nr:hypothetical protein [Bradymonadales bacterium]
MGSQAKDRGNLPEECRIAEAYGIDLTLLMANLERTPAARLAELQAMIALCEQIQRRTLSEEILTRREELELAETLRLFGPLERS